MAHRCTCGAFVARPTQTARKVVCASCKAYWAIPASKAHRSAVGRRAAEARAAKLTPEARTAIAKHAALVRWAK